MDKYLYDSILTSGAFNKKKALVDRVIKKEISRNEFPKDPNILNLPLSVSFPAQTGFSRYDIEISNSRTPVGKVFGIETWKKSMRYGLVTILLVKSPIVVVIQGTVNPNRMEVIMDDTIIGIIDANTKSSGTYDVQSKEGKAAMLLGNNTVRVENGQESFEFGLQLDLNYIPNIFSSLTSKKVFNPNVVYQPLLRFCNPLVVMSFLVSLRMIYRRFDFNNT